MHAREWHVIAVWLSCAKRNGSTAARRLDGWLDGCLDGCLHGYLHGCLDSCLVGVFELGEAIQREGWFREVPLLFLQHLPILRHPSPIRGTAYSGASEQRARRRHILRRRRIILHWHHTQSSAQARAGCQVTSTTAQ